MNQSFLSYFYHADSVVKIVMLLLLGASVISWLFIFQRAFFLKFSEKQINEFEHAFWSSRDLASFYTTVNHKKSKADGIYDIFKEGFKTYIQSEQVTDCTDKDKIANTERAMRIAMMKQSAKLEKHLSFLASVGSVSPYIGLFGTVWGIMNAFQSLSQVSQVSIAMVAPGISEALIATAMGLFTAIPAVLAYNRYVNQVELIQSRYDVFKNEFSALLERRSHYDAQ